MEEKETNPIKNMDNAKQKAIAALEELKKAIDKAASFSASADGPNAGWNYEQAEKQKTAVNSCIKEIEAL